LFSQFQADSDQSYAEAVWDRILAAVSAEHFTPFLRHYFCMFKPQVRAQDLFTLVRTKSPSPADALSFLNEIEIEAGRYAALADPEHELWATNPEARRLITALRLFGASQIFPLLLSAIPKLSPRELTRLLRLAVNQTFRYNVVGRLSTHVVEPVFNRAAIEVREGRLLSAGAIAAAIQSVYPVDEVFFANFETLELEFAQKRRLIGYILLAIEDRISGQTNDQNASDWSIEHVEPQSSDVDWMSRLGNLIPLEASLNRRGANIHFDKKRHLYQESRFELPKLVAQYPDWNFERMKHFQSQLAKHAVAIWRDDFESLT